MMRTSSNDSNDNDDEGNGGDDNSYEDEDNDEDEGNTEDNADGPNTHDPNSISPARPPPAQTRRRLTQKTTANSAPYQHKSDSATYPSLPLPMHRRVGILAIIHERSDESLMQKAEYQEIMLI